MADTEATVDRLRATTGLILGSPLTRGLMARMVLGLMLKSDMSIYGKKELPNTIC